MPRLLLCLLLSAALTACYPITQLQGARVLGKGKMAASLTPLWDNTAETAVPGAVLSLQGGVSDKVDLSGQLTVASVQLGVKRELLRGAVDASLTGGVVYAQDVDDLFDEQGEAAPHAQVFAVKGGAYFGVGGKDVAAWLAPILHFGLRWSRTAEQVQFREPFGAFGALLGVTLRWSEFFSLQPEIGFLAPFLGRSELAVSQFGPARPLVLGPGDYRLQGALGLLWNW